MTLLSRYQDLHPKKICSQLAFLAQFTKVKFYAGCLDHFNKSGLLTPTPWNPNFSNINVTNVVATKTLIQYTVCVFQVGKHKG